MSNRVIAYSLKIGGLKESITSMGQLKEATKEARIAFEATERGTAEGNRAQQRLAGLKQAQKEWNAEIRSSQKIIENASQAGTGSYREISARLSVLKRDYKEISEAQRESATGKSFRDAINKDTQKLKELDAQVGVFVRNVGDYENAIKRAFNGVDLGGILKGDISSLEGLGEAIDPLKSGFADLTGGAGGFAGALKLIGPAFGFQILAGGIASVTKLVGEAVEETQELRGLLSSVGGLEVDSELTDSTIAKLASFAKASGESQQKVFEATLALSKQFKITQAEAADLLQEAQVQGANATGELLDNAREYGTFFKDLGLSASQFLSIINQQVRAGVFSDKGVDSIKEAFLAIRDLPKAAREAINALGISDAALSDLKSERGILGVIQEIQTRLNKLPADSEIVGQVIADVFKSGGEDSGDFAQKVDLVNDGIEATADATNRLENQQREVNKQTEAYAAEQAKLEKQLAPALAIYNKEMAKLEASSLLAFAGVTNFFEAASNGDYTPDAIIAIDSAVKDLEDTLSSVLGNFFRDFGTGEGIDKAIADRFAPLNGLASLPTGFDVLDPGASIGASSSQGPTVSPVGVLRDPNTTRNKPIAPAKKDQKAAEDAAKKAADEAQKARDALTGIQAIQARLGEVRAEIAQTVNDAAASAVLEAEVNALESQEALLIQQGNKVIEQAKAFLPKLRADIAATEGELLNPNADVGEVTAKLVELNALRLEVSQTLQNIAQQDATSAELLATLNSTQGRPQIQIEALPNREQDEGVERLAAAKEIEDETVAYAKQSNDQIVADRKAAVDAQVEESKRLSSAFDNATTEIGNAFQAFYASEEKSAESFFRTIGQALLNTLDAQVYPLIGKAAVNTAASVPGPAGIALGLLTATALTGVWEGFKAVAPLAEGGTVPTMAQGGRLNGPRHSGGGIDLVNRKGRVLANAEGGEGVMKRKAMLSRKVHSVTGTVAEIGDMLNREYGGASWAVPGAKRRSYEQGGQILEPVYSANYSKVSPQRGSMTLSDESVERLAMRLEGGAERGTAKGARIGIEFLREIEALTTSFAV